MKNLFYTLFAISFCLLLGKGLFVWLDILPASLYGMLFYCLFLQLSWVDEHKVSQTNTWLIKNMGICFVPAGVGVIEHLDLLQQYGINIIVIIFISTFILLSIIGLIAENVIDEPSDNLLNDTSDISTHENISSSISSSSITPLCILDKKQ